MQIKHDLSNCHKNNCCCVFRIVELEARETSLRVEVSKLKDIAEVASSQVSALESQQVSREKGLVNIIF